MVTNSPQIESDEAHRMTIVEHSSLNHSYRSCSDYSLHRVRGVEVGDGDNGPMKRALMTL